MPREHALEAPNRCSSKFRELGKEVL
ncbi:Protein of unknown function [Propionibacterium freudenreichii]|nr:Protein of unknown function [Propionibacterium freudenreichii]